MSRTVDVDPFKPYSSFSGSFLWPVAPEYATGEVLLGGAYRQLVLDGLRDADVDLRDIDTLPEKLATGDMPVAAMVWEKLLFDSGGLASPAKSGQDKQRTLRQLMPLIPEIARYASVIGGAHRNRFRPGKLLEAALYSGMLEEEAGILRTQLINHLRVQDSDDLFARFVDQAFQNIHPPAGPQLDMELITPRHGAWREVSSDLLTPPERLCRDLTAIMRLKSALTRRQWLGLFEAVLRVGMSTYVLWLCRMTSQLWGQVRKVLRDGQCPTAVEIDEQLWNSHHFMRAFLEVGQDTSAMVGRELEEFAIGRIGVNLILQLLAGVGDDWNPKNISCAPTSGIAELLDKVVRNQNAMKTLLATSRDGDDDIPSVAGRLAEEQSRLLLCSSGYTSNLKEFLLYSLGQVTPTDNQRWSYDQAYLSSKGYETKHAKWRVQIGPSMLNALVLCCCSAKPRGTASIDDLKAHLADYGVGMAAGELQQGLTGTTLQVLGLVVDSPDAGGGRLLVEPFLGGENSGGVR